jgi:hypothetical protein
MLLLGCKPKGRYIEQHDIFFSIAESVKDLIPEIINFWPEAEGKIHIDAWREVTHVDGYEIHIVPKELISNSQAENTERLFFLNLGGYKEDEFDEFHYKMLTVNKERSFAIEKAKQTAFYKHVHFPGAESHIDDKYGVDVDDVYQIEDVLPSSVKEKYAIKIQNQHSDKQDKLNLGYFKLSTL